MIRFRFLLLALLVTWAPASHAGTGDPCNTDQDCTTRYQSCVLSRCRYPTPVLSLDQSQYQKQPNGAWSSPTVSLSLLVPASAGASAQISFSHGGQYVDLGAPTIYADNNGNWTWRGPIWTDSQMGPWRSFVNEMGPAGEILASNEVDFVVGPLTPTTPAISGVASVCLAALMLALGLYVLRRHPVGAPPGAA